MQGIKRKKFSRPKGNRMVAEVETTFLWNGSHACFPPCISSHEKSLRLVQDGQLV
jgi:hypothetical protein